MQNRAVVVEDNLRRALASGELPRPDNYLSLADVGLSPAQLVDLFESQLMSRLLDIHSRVLQSRGESFYTIGSSGHEGNAAVAAALRHTDMAFLHYRSGAFLVQRSKQLPGQTPLYDMLLSFAASSEDPISGGRHKVLGSKPLFVPPQTSTIASHLPKAVGAAFSIPLGERLGVATEMPHDSLVICNFGDASANHSTAQGAINAAAWTAYQGSPLPLIFLCEDNGIGISTPTPSGWIRAAFSQRPGLHYRYCDGLDLFDTYRTAREAARIARTRREPVFLHMRTVRLMGHAGSDAEIAYRSKAQIEANEALDPLLFSAARIVEAGLMRADQLLDLYDGLKGRIEQVAERAIRRPKLTTPEQVIASLAPERPAQPPLPVLPEAQREALFQRDRTLMAKPQPMGKLINWTLAELMAQRDNIVVCGEDVGAKGGVYHVTSGLLQKFGPARVINTLLDEQSILGLAIGMAHNGFLPIPEIQFLAYVHNAEDQIRGEAATLPFFSNGQYSNPMVIRIAGLGYQKGFGGHFHNDNSLAVFRDIPGLVIACPSNGADAMAMMRSAVAFAAEQQRVVVFIEPIALYMTRDLHEEGDGLWSHPYRSPAESRPIAVGEFGVHGEGTDLCILTYGNGAYLSRQAEKTLREQGVDLRIIDLRWLAPLDEAALAAAIEPCAHLLVVDECRRTGSISEALVTLVQERLAHPPAIARLTGNDCFIPLAGAATSGLPSARGIVDAALELLAQGKRSHTLEATE
ncbi:dehydrogenase E1 component subunit alpha/beta [Aestuariirhabdus litorea]|uniref:3-methyl-2-oxobutanoate dehydrogenase (2-methylpropanoyl-transferring) n=1 Tax=Aestuariirhabdus litorea TaxID=2528527 RepID=A0A3P3VME1_9GAMM|nr:alpha-ketoacid dehydrogenase subunit alpha/beta [Aestuariirhabdus litorea]RRJ83932.1 MFS transporter [Aestuariirhabdus litorea]RWW97154.1 MFS transporter [Endozoicomonadaceae bacterium GTF-13]